MRRLGIKASQGRINRLVAAFYRSHINCSTEGEHTMSRIFLTRFANTPECAPIHFIVPLVGTAFGFVALTLIWNLVGAV